MSDGTRMSVESMHEETEFYGENWCSPRVDFESVIVFVGY